MVVATPIRPIIGYIVCEAGHHVAGGFACGRVGRLEPLGFRMVGADRLGSGRVDDVEVVCHVGERLLEGGKPCGGDPVGGLDDDGTARC